MYDPGLTDPIETLIKLEQTYPKYKLVYLDGVYFVYKQASEDTFTRMFANEDKNTVLSYLSSLLSGGYFGMGDSVVMLNTNGVTNLKLVDEGNFVESSKS